ncbi:alpha/beta fold hydrolase [Massilia sp. PWRC2]|uniref:alpha/beta fold hydrolase n=1 Tax=Massilia sp. PWRC2 TaxID=2804626 RepID=UPI003CF01553
MNRLAFTFAIMVAIFTAAFCNSARAATAAPANRYVASEVPVERFEAGILAVERHGGGDSRGVALILVPGLSSGAWAWQDTVRRLKASHAIYVVTLPGFDGRPALAASAGPVLPKVRAALRQLIAERHLDQPVIIGHSLGATLAIGLAEEHPGLLRAVVAIDGLAVMPGTENTPPAMRAQMAAALKARMGHPDGVSFAEGQQQYMRTVGVTDGVMADQLAQLSARSDAHAVIDIMAEVLEQDLRAMLPKINVPLLLVAPYYQPDAVQRGLSEEMVKQYYASLMAGTPVLTVVSIAPSRHFVMFDQPAALARAIDAFIAPL